MTRILNSFKDVDNVISLMKYSERKAGRIPEMLLSDIRTAYANTSYGLRLNFLRKLKESSDINKYFTNIVNEENKD